MKVNRMEKRKKLKNRAGVRNTGSSGNERAAGVDMKKEDELKKAV